MTKIIYTKQQKPSKNLKSKHLKAILKKTTVIL